MRWKGHALWAGSIVVVAIGCTETDTGGDPDGAGNDAGVDATTNGDANSNANDDAGATDGGGDANLDAAVTEDADAALHWVSLVSRAWTLPPGSEGFFCTVKQVTQDVWITGFRRAVSAEVWRQRLWVADAASKVGDFDCNGMVEGTKFLSSTGRGANDLVFPAGVAMHVPAGKYLVFRSHVANLGSDTVTGTTGVDVLTTSAASVVHEADMIFAGVEGDSPIPAGPDRVGVGGCALPIDLHVFAVSPLMHRLGTHQKIVRKRFGQSAVTLHDGAFDSAMQSIYPMNETLEVNDQIQVDCTWNNTTGYPVDLGEHVFTEECLAAIYKWPVGLQAKHCVTSL